MRLSTVFYQEMDRQTEQMNQELEQFFTEYRQSDWPEWLVIVEFAMNNKIYAATRILPFIANYRRKLRMGMNIRRK